MTFDMIEAKYRMLDGGGWSRASIALVLLVAAAISLSGCAYKGAKVVEGTDLAVGLNVPMTEGTMQLQLLNYLSGFRLGVDRNANMSVKYTTEETNSYFGVVSLMVRKTVETTVEPVADPDAATCTCGEGGECTCGEGCKCGKGEKCRPPGDDG